MIGEIIAIVVGLAVLMFIPVLAMCKAARKEDDYWGMD